MPPVTRGTFEQDLAAARSRDGGYGLAAGGPSEVEPTAIAAIALEDTAARAWLARAQRPDGGFAARDGRPESPSVAALAALALGDGAARSRALDHVLATRAPTVGESGNEDGDGRNGWGWTDDSYSWVEPTSRVLLAIKLLRPTDTATREEAVRVLRERHCNDGGWNYGSTSVKGVDLQGYAQTTAVALMALQGERASLVTPGVRFLRSRWRAEPGGLTLAQTALALDLVGSPGGDDVREALAQAYSRTRFLGNTLALAWAALATAPPDVRARLRSIG